MKIKERLFLKQLYWRTRPALVEKYLRGKKIHRTANCHSVDRRRVKVAAAQLEIKLFKNPVHYVEEMYRHVKKAAESGVQLVVFPEYNSYQLFGLIPGIESMAVKLDDTGGGVQSFGVIDLLLFIGNPFNILSYTTFSSLAREFGIYLMAGSFPTPIDGSVMNRSALFAPDGALVGVQDKVHLMPKEHKFKLTPGSKLHAFDTELGRLALPVCMDATYFETFRILEKKGTEIVLLPISDPASYNYWLALRGIWPRVQESMVYGVKSALVGDFLGQIHTGKAGIFAPLELTPDRDGVLAEAHHFDREALVIAELNLEALNELKKNHPYLGDGNQRFMKKYFPSVYYETT
ncbi:MAG: nitrilase [Clostridiales bacterium]|jgi:predicted amidohydrolase|nr:nitrilase [Clostridiales bacterium]